MIVLVALSSLLDFHFWNYSSDSLMLFSFTETADHLITKGVRCRSKVDGYPRALSAFEKYTDHDIPRDRNAEALKNVKVKYRRLSQ